MHGDRLITRQALCMLAGVSTSELSLWENERLLEPASMSEAGFGDEVLYDLAALRRARLIRVLSEDLGVNLPGIDVILNLLEEIAG